MSNFLRFMLLLILNFTTLIRVSTTVPFNVSCLCNLASNTLQKPQDKTAMVFSNITVFNPYLALHRVLACAMLFQEHYNEIELDVLLCNVIWSCLDSIAWRFNLCNVVPRVLMQHCIGLFLMQCYVERLGQNCVGFGTVLWWPQHIYKTLHKIFLYNRASRATLHSVFS